MLQGYFDGKILYILHSELQDKKISLKEYNAEIPSLCKVKEHFLMVMKLYMPPLNSRD